MPNHNWLRWLLGGWVWASPRVEARQRMAAPRLPAAAALGRGEGRGARGAARLAATMLKGR